MAMILNSFTVLEWESPSVTSERGLEQLQGHLVVVIFVCVVADDKLPLVLADDACGTVDIYEGPACTQQVSELCSDISVISVEILIEACLTEVEYVSRARVGAIEELADLSETFSEVNQI